MKNILKLITNTYKRKVEYERQMMQLRGLSGKGNDSIDEVEDLIKWAKKESIHTRFYITDEYVIIIIKNHIASGRTSDKALELTKNFLRYKLNNELN